MAMSIRTITTTTALTPTNSRSSLLHSHLRLNQRDSCHFLGSRSLRSSSTSLQRVQIGSKILLMVVNSVDPSTPPLPSDPSGGSWKMWLFGILFSVIIPFTKNKWYPLLKLKEQVETALDAAEEVAELVENVSEKVEEVADEIGNHLPEGRLRHAAMLVEDLADKTGKAAALADDIIEKTEEVEREVDAIIEKANEEKKEHKIKEASINQADSKLQTEEVEREVDAIIEKANEEKKEHKIKEASINQADSKLQTEEVEREVDAIIEKANEEKKEHKIKEASINQADSIENETVAK